MKDIRIKNDTERFKFRVGGVVEHKGKYLIVKVQDNPFYCFAGGHVEMLEDTEKAIKRELEEELYFKVEIKKALCINENFYKSKNANFHEICFYYLATPIYKDISFEDKIINENDNGFNVIHRFKWVDKNELEQLDVKPRVVADYIKNGYNDFKHFITRE